jgi:hypothetical protein
MNALAGTTSLGLILSIVIIVRTLRAPGRMSS